MSVVRWVLVAVHVGATGVLLLATLGAARRPYRTLPPGLVHSGVLVLLSGLVVLGAGAGGPFRPETVLDFMALAVIAALVLAGRTRPGAGVVVVPVVSGLALFHTTLTLLA